MLVQTRSSHISSLLFASRTGLRIAILGTAALATACTTPDRLPTGPQTSGSNATYSRVVTGSRHRRFDEDRFVSLAREVPGLAGFFVDGQRNLVAFVKDTSEFEHARSSLRAHLASDGLGLPKHFQTSDVKIRKADFTFQELSDWRDIVSERILGTVSGVVYDDLDEAINRVTIGVLKDRAAAVQAAVRAVLEGEGIPNAAINFEISGGAIPLSAAISTMLSSAAFTSGTALNETADTVAAGYEILRDLGNGYGAVCSLGLILDRNGIRYASTASHCSTTMYALDPSDQWYQNGVRIYTRFIGSEAWDTTHSGPHMADLALIQLQATPSIRGAIGRTIQRLNGASASRTIDTSQPYIYISATSAPVTGVTVEKIGRTTGWTYGSITNTCQDFLFVDGTVVYCEMKTSVWVGQGDSGSSLWSWDGEDGATLYGVAGSAVDGDGASYETIDGSSVEVGPKSWFSSYNGLMYDMGSAGLSVTTSLLLGSVAITGSISNGNPVPSWTRPTVTNGSPSNTSYTLYRTTSVGGQATEQDHAVTTHYTGTEWLDLERQVTSYTGTSNPGPRFNWVSYRVVAYNLGVSRNSSTIYFKTP